jgi:hypothetical protein
MGMKKRLAPSSRGQKAKVGSKNPFNSMSESVEAFALSSPAKVDWSTKSAADKVLALISLQDFEGSWVSPTEVDEIMGLEVSQNPKVGDQKVWITLVVVSFLEQNMASEEGPWALVVEKARGWLGGLGLMSLDKLEKEAAEFVKKH